ncbi:hypothetical protein BH24ACT21_BH24ACT21_11910 [soil metagenome]
MALDALSSFFKVDSDVTVWSPQEGLNFALLFVFGLRYWPALLLNTPLHAIFVSGSSLSLLETGVFDVVETSIYAGAALLVVRWINIDRTLRHQRDVIWFVGVVCLAAPLAVSLTIVPFLTATAHLATENLLGNILSWWAGDATGIAMVAPVLLIFLSRFSRLWDETPGEDNARVAWPSREELPELAAQVLAIFAAVFIAYGLSSSKTLEYSYFAFIPVVWIAVRNGLVRTTSMLVLINVFAVTLVGVQGVRDSGITLQFSLMTLTIVGLLAGGIVTQRNRASERMRHEAFHDPLTGLPNRRLFTRRLEKAIHRAELDPGYYFAVLFLYLDRFKSINTNRGHQFGDRLLEVVAERLASNLGQEDTVARFGGDEFVLLLDGIDSKQEAARKADRLLEAFEEPYSLKGNRIYTSASIGIVTGKSDKSDSGESEKEPENLLRDADLALRHAKTSPQTKYLFFDEEMRRWANERFRLEEDLRRAVSEEEWTLEYQLIYPAGSDRPVGAEALVRWRHPGREPIPPDHFIPLAEETGLIVDLGHRILLRACRQMRSWRSSGHALSRISVNVSPLQLEHPRFAESVLETIEESGIAAQHLQLEFTEYWRINTPEVEKTLRRLAEAGISLVIDDFGTGYSSLDYLGRLPFHGLKIDRSFIQALPEKAGGRNKSIVEATLALSSKMGLEATAEGVETTAQLDYLHAQGCDLGQGYLFGKPKPAEEVTLS